jgi:ABC-2 type transport system ATP-binding protein
MIQVEGLTKHYGERVAIQDLHFHAEPGEILGFLGPNGAGKTTTMRILTGYMPPTSGTARLAGHDVVDDSLEVRRQVGYLPETVPLYPELSVSEYLAFMGTLRRVGDLDQRITEVLEQVGLADRADSFIGNLSKGLRQRVGLAQALLHRPPILILDEPTIGLDPAQIIEVRKIIQELGQERTILLSTHILSEAQQVCNRVLIINRGTIVAEDSPANLQSQLAGAERVRLQARADTSELMTLARSLPGVASVVAGRQEGEILVSSAPGQDVRPALARSIVQAGLDLQQLGAEGISLEEVFLQLTHDEAAGREEAEKHA